nr:signal peptidase I [Lachnospiraceae bacterium]
PKLLKEIFSWVIITVAAFLVALILMAGFGMKVQVIGDSMEPTLVSGQGVFVNRAVFKILSPQKGDIIVFLPNGNTNSHYYIKRVVAVPGETVQITDGSLYINGEVCEEGEDFDKMEDPGIAANSIKLQSGEYFVLGDNRNSSEDSRSANIGVVKTSMVVGKIWFKLGKEDAGGGFVFSNY